MSFLDKMLCLEDIGDGSLQQVLGKLGFITKDIEAKLPLFKEDDGSFETLLHGLSYVTSNIDMNLRLLKQIIADKPNIQRGGSEYSKSIDEYINSLAIYMPKEKRASGEKSVMKVDCCLEGGCISTDQAGEEKEKDADKKLIEKKKKKSTNRKRCFESDDKNEEEMGKKKKKRPKIKRLNFRELGLDPAPDYSAELKSIIGQEGDSDIKLVVMKQLFPTDISAHHERLLISWKKMKDRENFLTDEEKRKIRNEGSIKVKLIEPDLKTIRNLLLRQWDMNSSIYALNSGWKDVLRSNHKVLTKNAIVQLYSFRRQGNLWLVLKKIRDGESSDDGASTSQGNINSAAEQAMQGSATSGSQGNPDAASRSQG